MQEVEGGGSGYPSVQLSPLQEQLEKRNPRFLPVLALSKCALAPCIAFCLLTRTSKETMGRLRGSLTLCEQPVRLCLQVEIQNIL